MGKPKDKKVGGHAAEDQNQIWTRPVNKPSQISPHEVSLRNKDLATLTRMVNQELSLVSSWFNANKLTVHPDKYQIHHLPSTT